MASRQSWGNVQAKVFTDCSVADGVKLGWLINRQDYTVEIYRPDRPVEILKSPATLSGEDVLVGFRVDLKFVW